jgi:hypothetical protein
MLIKHAQVYEGDKLLWDNVTGGLDGRILIVRNRGIPKTGNFELRLADGTRRIMRSGAPEEAQVNYEGIVAYFTLDAVWK